MKQRRKDAMRWEGALMPEKQAVSLFLAVAAVAMVFVIGGPPVCLWLLWRRSRSGADIGVPNGRVATKLALFTAIAQAIGLATIGALVAALKSSGHIVTLAVGRFGLFWTGLFAAFALVSFAVWYVVYAGYLRFRSVR